MRYIESIKKWIDKTNEWRGFVAVRQGFMMMIPLILIGSFAIVLTRFPVAAYQNFMVSIFGDHWSNFGAYIIQGTFSIMSIGVVLTISYSYANLEAPEAAVKVNPGITAIVGLISLFSLIYAGNDSFPFASVGVMGVFIALLTALISSSLFVFLSKKRKLRLHMDNNAYDSNISAVFAALFPAAITVSVFAAIRAVLFLSGTENIHEAFNEGFASIFFGATPSLSSALAFIAFVHFLWFFGIHGSNVFEPVTQSVFTPVALESIGPLVSGQAASNMFAKEFFDVFVLMGGAGATLCLIIALLTQKRKSNAQNVSKFSILPGLFNINESMLFGIPVVLNIYYFIPFILTPVLLTLTTFAAMSLGLVPFPISSVEWTTPIFLSGYTATGSIAGAVLQGINLVVGILVYLPFVKLSEKSMVRKNKIVMNSLIRCALERQNGLHRSLVERKDAVGNLARILSVDLKNDIMKGAGLWLVYQPKLNYGGKVVGMEALLRWEHRLFGSLPAPLAVALAEDGGFIHRLGGWVLESACRQLKIWDSMGMHDIPLSINISPLQMEPHIILPQLRGIIEKTGANPSNLEIEITEQMAINQIGAALEIIEKFKEMGLKIAIDDFGMGHTSLLVLKEFQVDTVKLDGSLVKDITNSNSSRDVISSILSLAGKSGFSVVAEFVETIEQRDMLRSLGCTIYQGWLYSKALLPDEFFSYYEKANCEAKKEME